jgi:6-phosphogluconolactonase
VTSNREPQVIVATDVDDLARTAADHLLARVSRADGRAAVCLTGGASPQGLYRLLAREPWRNRLHWEHVHWFMGDDRFVPVHDELSNIGMARRSFLDHVPAPAGNIHAVPTNAGSPDEAARLYESELKRFYCHERLDPARPLFDLVLMGLGSDGHTASLFPHAAALEETQRWAVGVTKAGLAPFVPRVTLTFPALGSTHEMLFLVDGADKHDILRRVLGGENLPAARAHCDGALVWLVDRATGIKGNAAA